MLIVVSVKQHLEEDYMTQSYISRRRFLGAIAQGGAASLVAGFSTGSAALAAPAAAAATGAVFTLPPLPYNYNALEPHIDEQTMRIHHTRHHAAYVSNLNTALKDYPDLQGREVADLLYRLGDVPEAIRTTVRNNAGGHLNHSIFWATMGPTGGGAPVGALALAINQAFGDFGGFKQRMTDAAARQFGSGWAWLVLDGAKKLQVVGRPNQDSPVMDGLLPLVGVDVWEHAYYLKYQNRRADYLNAWWSTVNWEAVALRFEKA
jgi:Fe-Mn family superoxide dismutase